MLQVATVLTVYGIETILQELFAKENIIVATVLTVYGIETSNLSGILKRRLSVGCNSTYRLRYWNWISIAILFTSIAN